MHKANALAPLQRSSANPNVNIRQAMNAAPKSGQQRVRDAGATSAKESTDQREAESTA